MSFCLLHMHMNYEFLGPQGFLKLLIPYVVDEVINLSNFQLSRLDFHVFCCLAG